MEWIYAVLAIAGSVTFFLSLAWVGRTFGRVIFGPPHEDKPLEIIPMPVFRDVEELAKQLPEFKEHVKDKAGRYNTQYKLKREFDKELEELIIKTCRHEYDHEADVWYRCIKCQQDQPWYYSFDDSRECVCVKSIEDVSTGGGFHYMAYVLSYRSGVCRIHGRDYDKYWAARKDRYELGLKQAVEYQNSWENRIQPGPMFASGGIIKPKEY